MKRLAALLALLLAFNARAEVVLVNSTTSTEPTNTNTHVVAMPAPVTGGNILLCIFGMDGTAGDKTMTWPEPWETNKIFSSRYPSNHYMEVAWKLANGGETSITVTSSGSGEISAHACYQLSGTDDPTVNPPAPSAPAQGDNTNPDPPALTIPFTVAGSWCLAAYVNDNGNRSTTGFPTGYTPGETVTGLGTSGVSLGSAYIMCPGSPEDPDPFTMNAGEQWIAGTFAVAAGVSGPSLIILRRRHGY